MPFADTVTTEAYVPSLLGPWIASETLALDHAEQTALST
jgi:hypothetical protein